MHYDVVDVFIVGESNRTNSGGIKEPFFLFRFLLTSPKSCYFMMIYRAIQITEIVNLKYFNYVFFLFRFSAGWLKEWQEKLLYVFQVSKFTMFDFKYFVRLKFVLIVLC